MRDGECWPWLGAANNKGYGQVRINGKAHYVHRLHYELHRGEIPKGQTLRHKCDNPICCNPDHLEPGTQKQNLVDMAQRKRSTAKLCEQEVREIRALAGTVSQHELAKRYGVAKGTVSWIISRRSWDWLN
jgi:hypothetical protein